ncbi:MAG: hypothetical protein JRG97_14630 [Deltaproteobacteria bacterium]|nr:hypothetical protein [Deltaproteobacteria bacterium]MBW2053409.1 hypothetical protein [Deltaproteobacteria bacterium]MBW2142278.1 hypothetical protein [Deltaproteobacteria bacterium]MBW2324517.1 hypothetical protein [Deltaproteobacteria bacterium]
MSYSPPIEDVLDPKGAKNLVKQLKKDGHKAKYVGSVFGYMVNHYPQDEQVTILSVKNEGDQRSIISGYRNLVERAIEKYGNKTLVRFMVIKLDEHDEFVCGIAGGEHELG